MRPESGPEITGVPTRRRGSGGLVRWVFGAVAVLLVLVGFFGLRAAGGDDGRSSAVESPPRDGTPSATPRERTFPTGIEPERIVIPAIGVDADVVDLDLGGPEPEVPSDFDEAGWYTATRLPGEIGPAVVAGHIDSTAGPAVFFRLDELEAGDRIEVLGRDGGSRAFEVVDHGQYPKERLPDEVFGFGDPVPELRLITCGGTFDRSTGSYRDNYVVYAQEVSS